MEIVHIVLGKANPERMNGVNKVVFQLATEQANAGKKVSVWGITKDLTHNYGYRNFETELFKAHRNPFALDKSFVKSLSKKKKDTIFHIHGGWIPVFYTISKLFAKCNVKFVFTPHGAYNTIALEKSSRLKKIYFQLFERHLLKRASKIHCIGKSEVLGLNKIFKTDKTVLLPYGFEISNSLRIVNKEEVFTIGFVGRIDIYTKGLDLLLDAFKLFQLKVSNTRLWIVGDGDSKSELERMILDRSLSNSVVLWGSKFGSEKDDLINKFDVFVHPSRNEGLPSAVLEAASFGVPCVVSEATNVGDVIKEFNCGLVVNNEDVNALFEAFCKMNDIWNLNKLTEQRINSKKMIKEAFGWGKIVEDFDTLYK